MKVTLRKTGLFYGLEVYISRRQFSISILCFTLNITVERKSKERKITRPIEFEIGVGLHTLPNSHGRKYTPYLFICDFYNYDWGFNCYEQ